MCNWRGWWRGCQFPKELRINVRYVLGRIELLGGTAGWRRIRWVLLRRRRGWWGWLVLVTSIICAVICRILWVFNNLKHQYQERIALAILVIYRINNIHTNFKDSLIPFFRFHNYISSFDLRKKSCFSKVECQVWRVVKFIIYAWQSISYYVTNIQ